MEYSKRQKDLFYTFENESVNILASSVAGSGKTTTLIEMLKLADKSCLFLAFNKSIKEEITNTIEELGIHNAQASTLHSLGLRTLAKTGKKFTVKGNKSWEIVNIFQKQEKEMFKGLSYKEKMTIIVSLISMLDAKRLFVCDTFDEMQKALIVMGKPVKITQKLRLSFDIFWKIYKELTYEDNPIIDFTDMIYIPASSSRLSPPVSPSYLFIDECQDLSVAQHMFIDKIIQKTTTKKWVAVGDPYQAIYGFGGSSVRSYNMFKEKDNVKSLPLDVCYRCPTSVVKEANKVYDIMQSFKEDQGIVSKGSDISNIKPRSLVICRNVSPLIELYFVLLSQNREVYIKGKDIIAPIIKFLKSDSRKKLSKVISNIKEELSKLDPEDSADKLKNFIYTENLKSILIFKRFLEFSDDTLTQDFIDELNKIQKKQRSEDAIELSTIHKAKGLGRDIVYILNRELIPSQFATTEEQLQQEKNLLYVAITRAKKELHYINI